ncbi:MAG: hypothetical protein FJ086_13540 [Deltaproteobacteria bacterium]|nr:hypothetical protein [Deltaproteobacteria bacterium]
MRSLPALAWSFVLLSSPAVAGDTARPAAFKVPALDLGLSPPPTGEELKARPAPVIQPERPEARPDEEGISVVRVEHGTSFSRTAEGLRAKTPLLWLGLPERSGATPAFSTVVRIRSAARADLEVQVRVLDPRGAVAMESEGAVSFRGSSKPELDHVVDWAPTVLRGGGRYTVEVSLNRHPAGSFPLEIRDGVRPATAP